MEYLIGFVVLVLSCVVIYQYKSFNEERKEWFKERADLIDKMYAKTTQEYVMMTKSDPKSYPRDRESLYKLEKLKKAQENVEKFKSTEGV